MNSLTFRNTSFDIIDRDGRPWLRAGQIAEALGYADDKAVHRIYARNSDEFTDAMTGVVKLTTAGGEQETRIFSIRGANLIGMKAKTEIAKEFRVWTLDVLEGKSNLQNSGQNATLPHLINSEQAGELFNLIADRFQDGKDRPYAWSRFANHFRVAKYRELPASKFGAACAYIATMPTKQKELPAPDQSAIASMITEEHLIKAAKETLGEWNFWMYFDERNNGTMPAIIPVSRDHFPISNSTLANHIASSVHCPAHFIPAIIQAAAGRLA